VMTAGENLHSHNHDLRTLCTSSGVSARARKLL
jgi:hypothetical protein